MSLSPAAIRAFAPDSPGAAARALWRTCTLTLELPAGAQADAPTERPLGSVITIEVSGTTASHDAPARRPLPTHRPALLTLTF